MKQHLHTVAQGIRNSVQDIGSAHEQDLGQVDGDIQVVVQEAGVLLRVQQLQQRARRVALVACAATVILSCRLKRTLESLNCCPLCSSLVAAELRCDASHIKSPYQLAVAATAPASQAD